MNAMHETGPDVEVRVYSVGLGAEFDRLAAETALDPSYVEKISGMIERGELEILGLEESGTFVGRISLWLAPADEQAVRESFWGVPIVNALQLNPEVQGRGLGKKLMEGLHAEATRLGYTRVGLGVEPDNTTARRLYEKLGYEYRKISGSDTYETCWDETGDDGSTVKRCVPALFMTKELSI